MVQTEHHHQEAEELQESRVLMPETAEFQLASIWRVLRGQGRMIFVLTLLGLSLGFGFSLLQETMYTSTAMIEVGKRVNPPLAAGNPSDASGDFTTSDQMMNAMMTEQAELESATVALSVIEQLKLTSSSPYDRVNAGKKIELNGPQTDFDEQNRLLKIFQSHLKIALVKDTRLIEVSFSDTDPQRAALIANTIVDNYVRLYSQARSAASAKESAFLSAQLSDLRSQVLDSEKRVNDYEAATGIVGPTQEVGATPDANTDSVIVNRFIELNRDLTAADVALNLKRAVYIAIGSQDSNALLGLASGKDAGDVPGPALSAISADLGMLNSLHQQRSQLMLASVSRSVNYGAKSPEREQLQAQLKEIDGQIEAEIVRIRKLAKEDYDLAAANKMALERLVADQKREVNKLSIGNNQLHMLQQEAASKRTLYQELFGKYEEANVSTAVNATHITLVDPARASSEPSSPKRMRNMATGLITGCVLGIFLAFLSDLPGSNEGSNRVISRTLVVLVILMVLHAEKLRAQNSSVIPANLDQVPSLQRRMPNPPASGLTTVPEDFSKALLEPGYLLEFQVYGVPELSSTLRVDEDGMLTVPVLGPVHVAGKSVSQARATLASALSAAELVNHPQVTLNVIQYATGNVAVLGEVQNPGRISLLSPHNLEDVLAMAGGETTAAGDTIEIQRPNQPTSYVHYLRNGVGSLANFEIRSGDSIYVRRAGVIYVLGAVYRPGGYLMVNHGQLNVLQAISLAQGSTLVAKTGNLYVIRTAENGTVRQIKVAYNEMIKGKTPPMVLDVNDILYVPTSTAKSVLLNGAGLIGTAATAAIYRTP